MSIAIKAENISKQYQLGEISTGAISHDINRWWHKIRGKENPYLKIGDANDRSTKGESDYVWSLRDINFEIQQGDAVGIIGRNGAGKSTLLKILSKVTQPTTGTIKTKGRIASLLEVGTGFHPELSGKDNIYLNGAILGMRKAEIRSKFDEIVDFSGVERYIDTPVKRYSSGMYVRLAFAVAAYLESEILIVDEVLAVGDAEFQKKCLGKMSEVTGEGRTVLFVSHNMAAISQLCNKGIFIKHGELVLQGNTSDVVFNYYNDNKTQLKKTLNKKIQIIDFEVRSYKNDNLFTPDSQVLAKITVNCKEKIDNCYVNFVVEDSQNMFVIHERTDNYGGKNLNLFAGLNEISITISRLGLKPNVYSCWFRLYTELNSEVIIEDSENFCIEVNGSLISGVHVPQSFWNHTT